MPILRPEERVGSVLAQRYRLDRILGKGGMGVVFAGTHTWTNRPIAVKLLLPQYAEDKGILQRFFQEARAAAALAHPHVIDVIDMGEDDDGDAFIVLEFLDGEPMTALMKREGALEFGTLLEIVLPVMDALAEAHSKGILHRDLKPDNIYLAKGLRGRKVPKLLDFGIAKLLESQTIATGTGGVLGTPHYMAPEQARGDKDLDARADIWSMGVVCFQALSGKLPFVAETPTVILVQIMTKPAPPLRDVAPNVHPAVAAVVDRALAADRKERLASMAEMMTALIDAATGVGIELEARLLEYRDREAPAAPATRPSLAGKTATAAPVDPVAPAPVDPVAPTLDEPGPTADLRPPKPENEAQPSSKETAAEAPLPPTAIRPREPAPAPIVEPTSAVSSMPTPPTVPLLHARPSAPPPAARRSIVKTLAVIGGALLVLAVGFVALAFSFVDDSRIVVLANDSDDTIARVYLRRGGRTEWGNDRLGGVPLSRGRSVTLRDFDCDTYDVRIVDSRGRECVMASEWLCAGASPYHLDDADVAACLQTPAGPR